MAMNNQDSEKNKRDYWVGEVYIQEGWAQATELVEQKTAGDDTVYDVMPIRLGRIEDILPVLQGKQKIPDDMHPRCRAVLESILEREGIFYGDAVPKRNGIQRTRHSRTTRYKQRHARYAPFGKRLSLSQVDQG
jgi:hypothetical protein